MLLLAFIFVLVRSALSSALISSYHREDEAVYGTPAPKDRLRKYDTGNSVRDGICEWLGCGDDDGPLPKITAAKIPENGTSLYVSILKWKR